MALNEGEEGAEARCQLPGRLPKSLPAFFFRPHHGAWIRETPVDPLRVAWEHGAQLAGAIAERGHKVERLARELVHVLRALVADVYPRLPKRPDG